MAGFKTAYLQREVYLDLAVVGDCKVGDFVVLTAETSSVQAYIKKATAAQVTARTANTTIVNMLPTSPPTSAIVSDFSAFIGFLT